MNSIARISFIAFALVALGSPVEAQNLILNGGFESPVIPSNTLQTVTPTSWTAGSFTAIVNGNGSHPALPSPLEGQQYVAVATSQTLSQMFMVAVASEHQLQWFDGAPHEIGGPASVPYTVDVLSETPQIVASATLDALHPEDWIERSISMNLNAGNYTLRFTVAGGGVGGFSPLFDNVSLIVPEPHTVWLIFAAGIMVLRYRIPRPQKLCPALHGI